MSASSFGDASHSQSRVNFRNFNYPPPQPPPQPSFSSTGRFSGSASFTRPTHQSNINCDATSLGSTMSSVSLASSVRKCKPVDLTCFLCKRLFEEPMILSCGHSFCLRCVEKWLRKCTNCPVCRTVTLEPIHNITLAEMLAEYKKLCQQTQKNSSFQRSITQPLMRTFRRGRTDKEAKTIQKESIRASQRRAKQMNFGQPKFEQTFSASKESKQNEEAKRSTTKKEIRGAEPKDSLTSREEDGRSVKSSAAINNFQRMSNLRRSLSKLKQKISSADERPIEAKPSQDRFQPSTYVRAPFAEHRRASIEDISQPMTIHNVCHSSGRSASSCASHNSVGMSVNSPSLTGLQVFVLSTAREAHLQYTINQAFVSSIENVELAELPEADEKAFPFHILDSMHRADRTVLLYSAKDVVSFRRLLEFFSQSKVLSMCSNVQFTLISLHSNSNSSDCVSESNAKQGKRQGERLARLLHTELLEMDSIQLASRLPSLLANSIQPEIGKRPHRAVSSSGNGSMMSIREDEEGALHQRRGLQGEGKKKETTSQCSVM